MKNKSITLNAVLNIVKTSCSILFPLITFPYVSRILGAANYGKYSFSNSIISYFLLVAMLGINTYGIREGARIREDKQKLTQFSAEITSINLISVLISMLALVFCVLLIPQLYKYRMLIFILSSTIICTFLGREWINTVFEDFSYITIRYIIIQIISLILIFVFVKQKNDYVIYTLIVAFSASAGYIVNLFYTKKYIPFVFTHKWNLKTHFLPISILFCSQLATAIYIQSDITMLGFMETETQVGIYSFSSKIYLLSKTVINALTTVGIPRIVSYLGKNDYNHFKSFSNKLLEILILFTVPSTVGLFLLSKNVLIIIGGNEYIDGVVSLEILAIALIFAVLSGFFANAILVPLRREKEFLIITLFAAFINISINFFLIPSIGITGAAMTTLVSEAFVMFASIYRSRKFFEFSIPVKDFKSIGIGSIFIFLICIGLRCFISNLYLYTMISIILSVIVYGVVLIAFRNSAVYPVICGIKNKFLKL